MTQQVAEYIDHMGDDQRVVDVARISFGPLKKVTTPEQDASLIRFLANGVTSKDKENILLAISNGFTGSCKSKEFALECAEALYEDVRHQAVHWTPFAHTAITLRMKAPIPVRTQAFKHKQGMVENEESRRYISTHLSDLEIRLGLTLCKRGRSGFELTDAGRITYQASLELLQQCETFASTVAGSKQQLSGRVTIAIIDTLVSDPRCGVAQAFAALKAKSDNLQFDIYVCDLS